MTHNPADFVAILQTLESHQVDYIVVGALSAVLQGAPVMTFDVDIVHKRSTDNITRLLEALDELNARYRGHSDSALRPDESHLHSTGHQLLMTDHGPLDVLGTIEDDLGYGDLVDKSEQFPLDDVSIQVLNIETYVALKEASSTDKDRSRLPLLRRTLQERSADDSDEE